MPEAEELTQPISTGFAEISQPQSQPQPEAAPVVEAAAPVDPPVSQSTEPVVIANITADGPPALSEVALANQAIYDKIMEARNQPPAVRKLEPPIPFVTEQTKREMAHGAAMNKHFEAIKNAPRAVRRVDNSGGTNTPVYRPRDHVPNFNQGNVSVKPVA
jgi:hypothetical protein